MHHPVRTTVVSLGLVAALVAGLCGWAPTRLDGGTASAENTARSASLGGAIVTAFPTAEAGFAARNQARGT